MLQRQFAEDIKTFLNESDPSRCRRSQWFRNNQVELYLRRSFRCFEETPRDAAAPFRLGGAALERNCIDVANVEVFQGEGVFREIMALILEHSPYRYVVLECVNNEKIDGWAKRRGWTLFDVNCYYMILKEGK